MFSPVAMKRLSVVVLERDGRSVLRTLGRMGVMHLLRTEAGPETAPLAAPDRSAELARAEALMARIEGLRDRLGVAAFPGQAVEYEEIGLDQAEAELHPIEERVNTLLARRQEMEQRSEQVCGLLERVESYQDLDIPLDWIGESRFIHFAIGYLPAGRLEDVRSRLGPNVVLMPMPSHEQHWPLVAVTTHAAGPELDKVLREVGFVPEAIPAKEGATTATLFAESREECQWLGREMKALDEQVAAAVAEVGRPLGDLWHRLAVERRILEAEQNFPRTEQTSLVTGWVPAPDVSALRQRLDEITAGRNALSVSDPGNVPEDDIPVLLRYPRILRPFASLVTGYGLPKYREFAPTILFAITFVLMFGMMFGDAGHGGVLVAGALYLLVCGKTQSMRDSGLLVLLMGLSSVAFGVVYGSYFGILWNPLWHDPLEGDPMELMALAIGLGVLMMSAGLVLNIINRLRHGDWLAGLLDKFGVAGALFYWGVLAVALKWATVERLGAVVLGVMILAPLVAIALKEPLHVILSRRGGRQGHGNLGEACMESLIEAFDAVLGYLSNTVSFVRLAAYSIAHAAVLMAAFAIAHDMGQDVKGRVIGLAVIIAGNVIAIALEGIVATVQAIRLEYYEFFGKFFSGGGKPFAPFRIHRKPE